MIQMNDKFVYVFSEEDKQKMLLAGYKLLTGNDVSGVYVFENSNSAKFSMNDVRFATSNVLRF